MKNVLVLGGGFAGIDAAIHLKKKGMKLLLLVIETIFTSTPLLYGYQLTMQSLKMYV